MNVIKTDIADLLIIEPRVFGDDRGFFYESFNEKLWSEKTGVEVSFVQDNHSRSSRGVLRGLHYQMPPAAQGKLVRCVSGEVFDVAVDIIVEYLQNLTPLLTERAFVTFMSQRFKKMDENLREELMAKLERNKGGRGG